MNLAWLRKNTVLITIAGIAMALALKKIMDLDLWWHLAAGRWMWENKSFISTDPFSFTQKNSPWVSITWGYEFLIYLLQKLAGGKFYLITLVHGIWASATVVFAFASWRIMSNSESRREEFVAFFVFLAAICMAEFRWIDRPELLTHLFGAMMLFLFLREREDRALFLVPVVQVLWSNFHGIFILGPFIASLFWLERVRIHSQCGTLSRIFKDRVTIVALLTYGACFINPRGITGALFPFHLLQVLNDPFFQKTIPEAQPPFSGNLWASDAWSLAIWLGLFAAAFVVWLFRKSQRRFWPLAILSLILIWFSLSARRNISLLILWSLPFVAAQISFLLGPWLKRFVKSETLLARSAAAVGILFIAGVVTNFYREGSSSVRFGFEMADHVFPTGVADFLRHNDIDGRIFANVELADFMLFQLPGFQPYIDGRFAEVYPKDHFKRYMDILAQPSLLEEETAKYNIRAVAMTHGPFLAKGFLQYLGDSPQWKLAYFDEVALVYVRQDVPLKEPLGNAFLASDQKIDLATDLNSRARMALVMEEGSPSLSLPLLERLNLLRMKFDIPRGYLQLADADLLIGKVDWAIENDDDALRLSPRWGEALSRFCLAQFSKINQEIRSGELSEDKRKDAIAATKGSCQLSLEEAGDPLASNQVLGLIGLLEEKPQEAVPFFEKVVHLDSANYQGFMMLGEALEKSKQPYEAERAYVQAVRLRPFEIDALIQLAAVSESAGDLSGAQRALTEAYRRKPLPQLKEKLTELENRIASSQH